MRWPWTGRVGSVREVVDQDWEVMVDLCLG